MINLLRIPASETSISSYFDDKYAGCILLILGLTPTLRPPINRRASICGYFCIKFLTQIMAASFSS